MTEKNSITGSSTPSPVTNIGFDGEGNIVLLSEPTPADHERAEQEKNVNPKAADASKSEKPADDSWQLNASGSLAARYGQYDPAFVDNATVQGQGLAIMADFELTYGPLSASVFAEHQNNTGHKGPKAWKEGEDLKLTETNTTNIYYNAKLGGTAELSSRAKLSPMLFLAQERTTKPGNTAYNGVFERERWIGPELTLSLDLLKKDQTFLGFKTINASARQQLRFYTDRSIEISSDGNQYPRHDDRIHSDSCITLKLVRPFLYNDLTILTAIHYSNETRVARQPGDKPGDKPRVNSGEGAGDRFTVAASMSYAMPISKSFIFEPTIGGHCTMGAVAQKTGQGTNDFGDTERGTGCAVYGKVALKGNTKAAAAAASSGPTGY